MSAQARQGRRQPAASTDNRKGTTMARTPKPVEPVEDATPVAAADDGLTAVRTTINPHEVIRVGDAELLDLERQGLIYSGTEYDDPAEDEGEAVESGIVTDSAPIAPPTGDATDIGKGPGE